MAGNVLEPSDQAIRKLAEEIAAYAPGYDEGDSCELLIETQSPATAEMLAKIRDGVKGTGVELLELRQDPEGVHVKVRVGVLPLLMIAVISLGALIPVGVIGWKLFRWTPEQMTRFLLPFALIVVGAAAVIVRPRPVTFVFGAGMVGGGAYLAMRKAPVPPEVRASIIDFTWERPVSPAAPMATSAKYAMAGR